MAAKNLNNVRLNLKHDTEENWLKATNFTPNQGEPIVYDKDATYNYARLKIGDGSTNVNSLPFINVTVTIDDTLSDDSTNPVQNKVIKAALDTLSAAGVVVDSTLSDTSINPVQNKVITVKVNEITNSLNTHTGDSNIHVTSDEKEAWNSKSDFSGKYTDLTDVPTDLATTTYVDGKVAALVDSAPETLDTLEELASALGNDENFATTVTNSIAEKASKSELEAHTDNSDIHVTSDEKQTWNNKSNFSGSYTDLTNIPTDLATTTYVDGKVAEKANITDLNAALIRIQELETQQAAMLAKLQTAVFIKQETTE